MIHVEAIDSQVLFRDRTLLKQSEEFNKTSSPRKQTELEKKQFKTIVSGLQKSIGDKQGIEKCLFMKIC